MENNIEVKNRLLSNLDIIDKNISRVFILLIFISLFYLSLYYGISPDENVKLLILNIKIKVLFYIGCPLILIFFQYTSVAGLGTLRLEDELINLNGAYSPKTPHLRYPTHFSLLFVFADSATTIWQKIVFFLHFYIVVFFYYLFPALTCIHIIIWLINNSVNDVIIVLSIMSTLIVLFEIIFSLFISSRKIIFDTKIK